MQPAAPTRLATGAVSHAGYGCDAPAQEVCLFLDAEIYFEVGAPRIFIDLLAAGGIPPTTAVFLSYLNDEARRTDLTCNPRFSRYVAKEVIPWILRRHPGAAPTGHAICGISLSGLASTYLAFDFPVLFPRALCQSGAF